MDITVIGNGPSGLFLTYYLSLHTKYKIAFIALHNVMWHCTYGSWVDEIKESWLSDTELSLKKIFQTELLNTEVISADNDKIMLNKKYALLDNKYIFNKIYDNIKKNPNIRLIDGQVINVDDNKNNIIIYYKTTEIVTNIRSKQIFNCTGMSHFLTRYNEIGLPTNWQIFYGKKIKLKQPHNIKNMILMDWRQYKNKTNIPSFAYIIPINPFILFIEETILIYHTRFDLEELSQRLDERIMQMDLAIDTILETETYSIPMGGNLPKHNQKILSFGLAAKMSHPATGYMVGYTIYRIPYIIHNKNLHNISMKTIIPMDEKIKYYIYVYGGELLKQLNTKELSLFFTYFFKQPDWNKYLTRRLSSNQLILLLINFFISIPFKLKIIMVYNLSIIIPKMILNLLYNQ